MKNLLLLFAFTCIGLLGYSQSITIQNNTFDDLSLIVGAAQITPACPNPNDGEQYNVGVLSGDVTTVRFANVNYTCAFVAINDGNTMNIQANSINPVWTPAFCFANDAFNNSPYNYYWQSPVLVVIDY